MDVRYIQLRQRHASTQTLTEGTLPCSPEQLRHGAIPRLPHESIRPNGFVFTASDDQLVPTHGHRVEPALFDDVKTELDDDDGIAGGDASVATVGVLDFHRQVKDEYPDSLRESQYPHH